MAERETPPMPPGGEAVGAWFDYDAADKAVAFFPKFLRHTEAEWWGKPFILAPWQARDLIRPVFGWKRADGTRLIRQTYWEIPRKNGKTELAAGVSLLALVGDGEFGGQGYSMAVDKEQAKIVFHKASSMASMAPEALQRRIEAYKTSLYVPELMASLKPLSARPGGKHGFSPSFAIADELHEWPDGELHDVVHKGTAARRQPLEVLITTAGKPGVGYGWELHERAVEIIKGNIVDPSFYAKIYAAEPEDDWQAPATWRKANPNFGVSVKEDYLASEAAAAVGNVRKEGEFKRYHLNLWSEQNAGGLPMEHWDGCEIRPARLEDLAGRRCWAGLDMSSTTDLTALVLVAPCDNGAVDVWCRFWLPTADLEKRIKRDRVPYDQWIRAGFVVPTEGDVVDYDAVRAFISGGADHPSHKGASLIEIVQLVELAIDRWNATHITTQLTADGLTVVPFGQGFASMSAPSKELERLVIAHALNHGRNPVLRWMAQCVTFIADGAENVKPVKPDRRRTPKRIDGIVALVMALGRSMSVGAEQPPVPQIFIL